MTKQRILEMLDEYTKARGELQSAVVCYPAVDPQPHRERCQRLRAEFEAALDQFALAAARHWG